MPFASPIVTILKVHWPLALCCAVLAAGGVCAAQVGAGDDPRDTVAAAVNADPADVVVVDVEDGVLGLVTAGAPADLWAIPMRLSPAGVPIRVGYPRNLTRTAGAAEHVVASRGSLVLVAQEVDGGTVSLTAFDLSGEPASLTAAWSPWERSQAQISNWQATGAPAGIGWQRLVFDPPLRALEASAVADRTFAVRHAGGPWGAITFSAGLEAPPRLTLTAGDVPRREDQTRGRSGHLGWLVDTVRDVPMVGSDKIAVLEDVAFELVDRLKRRRQALGDAAAPEAPGLLAEEAAEPWHVASGDPDDATSRVAGDVQDRRVWPPRAAEPKVAPPGPGEGVWKPVTTLVRPSDDGTPYLYQSWLRPDPSRGYARVSVTAFDPARVELGVVAGTREPESTTGLKGSGSIPRRPGLMPRVVAAFNGGFQSKHGPYGMVEEDRVLVPPAGDAATVAATSDGRVLLGTWPAAGPSPGWKSLAPGLPIPSNIHSLRQNLQPLVANGRLNPDRRKKWGSVAGKHIKDDTHTVRTGICLLDGGGVAYFFGPSLSADTLGQAMLDFHCDYGVHLDMNSGHSGFEFYRVEDDAGEKFEAARMIKDMWHMNFPRYIGRDARDFFYLRLRETPRERLSRETGLTWRTLGGRLDAPGEVLEAVGHYRLPAARTTARIQAAQPLPPGSLLLPVATGDASVDVAGVRLPVTARAVAFTVVGHSPRDVFVAVTDDVPGVTATMSKWGCTQVVTIPRPAAAAPVLRLMDGAGAETLRGGPLDRDGAVLAFTVAPDTGRSGRIEPEFVAED